MHDAALEQESMSQELDWHPLLGIVGAIVIGLPMWAWSTSGAAWGPPLVYGLLATWGALWMHGHRVPRTMAAYLVTAGLVFAWLLPIGSVLVEMPL